MCVVSMITDHYIDKWKELKPPIEWPYNNPITQDEIEELRKLLEKAKEYDKKTGQPDCELDSKRQALKEIAKELGVEIAFL